MHYSNHDNRLRLPKAAAQPAPQKFFSLERGARGIRLCVRTAATMTRRKLTPVSLPAAAAFVLAVCLSPIQLAQAQLGTDPFAGNAVHTEERWTAYSDAAAGGTNRPTATFVDGANVALANATSFNFGVTAPNPSNAFITSGGNIYSPTAQLTLTLTSNFPATVGAFNTVVFSLRTFGSSLNTAGVFLTPSGGPSIAPLFSSIAMSGSGMGATAQYAFQFDLSGVGGSNSFTISVPGSAPSTSFSSSQLDATTAAYGAQSVVPEPSSVALVVTALGGLSIAGLRCRRRK